MDKLDMFVICEILDGSFGERVTFRRAGHTVRLSHKDSKASDGERTGNSAGSRCTDK